jgi:glycerophosphoryl diester phosphodiesterase
MLVIGALLIGISILTEGEPVMSTKKHIGIVNISHRGASSYAPEHTIPSYRMGEEMYGDYIEIDLQMTKDGNLIAMHDEKVDRTTNGTGLVNEYTMEQIKQLDAGSWFNEKYPQYAKSEYVDVKVSTLEEIFQEFGTNKKYYIETKSPETNPGMENELLRLVNEYDINKNTLLVQSFSSRSLKTMNNLDSSLKLIQLLSYKNKAVISYDEISAIKEYAIGIGTNHVYLNKQYVHKVVNSGLELHPFTVNDKKTMKKLINWGVTGMFTNFPDRLHDVKEGRDT